MACQAPLVHEILLARILEWVAISFSRGSSWCRDRIWVSCVADRLFHLSHQGSPIHTYTYTHTYIYKAIYILRLFSLIDYYKILHTVPCFIQYIGCLFVTGQSWARAGHLREQSHLSLSILETKLTPSFCVILTSKEKCFELKSNRRNHPSTQSVSLILSCWRLQIPD